MFKLSLKDQGGAFLFLPDSFTKSEVIVGSGIKRTITGKAKRSILGSYHRFSIGVDWLTPDELLIFHHFFTKNTEEGIIIVLEEDNGNIYECLWSGDFNLAERKQSTDEMYGGTFDLEEV